MGRGLPSITQQTVIFLITQVEIPIPEEPKPDFETQGTNRIPLDGEDQYEHWYTTFDSVE